ncbi:MAG: alanine/glycine:cation symporter family protein [Termitinemataceae bacterium]|nr:MAG: alanine/glycine:cation symporter family protein [Termitinemataceae bacterium]
MEILSKIIGNLSNYMYTYVLIILLLAVGLYFTVRTKFVQFRLLKESIRLLTEPKEDEKSISSFQALMLSTASRVGVGNIAGVSVAICLGGAGAVFWMWLIAIIGSASAFIESTLAQIYKRRDGDGNSYGGPAYYIQGALNRRPLGVVFAVMLILTYMGGFNMVASFNLTTAFEGYSFWNPNVTPTIIGAVVAVFAGTCIFGGGKRLSKVTSILVPAMAIAYIAFAIIIMVLHINLVPGMFKAIFSNAFDFESAFGGFTGSCIMLGIKRGLYSNEAGVGSAPNAAASASVSHPVKQGLVQMLSVYIDTIVICSATAFLLLCSGVAPSANLRGVPYVQAALANTFGNFGIIFVTFALFCFAFTTLLGNYFYAEQNLKYLVHGNPKKSLLAIFRAVAVVIIFFGSQIEFGIAWDTADVLMGFMALMNLPIICFLSKPAIRCLNDYISQKKRGESPVFKAVDIDLRHPTDYWH